MVPLLALAPGPSRAESLLSTELERIEPLIWRDPWQARSQLQQLAPMLETASKASRALYYQRLAHALHFLYLDKEFDGAVSAGMAAVDAGTPPSTRAFLTLLDGVRERRRGDYQRAAERMQQAVETAQQEELAFLSVFSQAELGLTFTLADDTERALVQLQRAYGAATGLRDPFLLAVVNESFGGLYSYTDEHEKSLEHYQKALDTYAALGYAVYEAEATYGFAMSYRYARQWDKAVATFQRYRQLTEGNHSDHGTFMANYGLGMTHAERGDCPRALSSIGRALETPGPLDFKAELYKRQAVCLAENGQAGEAGRAIAAARAIFAQLEELKGSRWELEVLKAEAEVQALLGRAERAYALLQDYHEKSLALHRRKTSERLMTLRVEMEDARKDYQIELLKEQSRVDALNLEQQQRDNTVQRWTTASWIGATCIAVAFLGVQLRNTRRFRDLSIRDELTGLYNRRYIFRRLRHLMAELPPDRGQLSIVLFDVDNFKHINDHYGHPAGDSVLEAIAAQVSGLLRPGDQVARVGGEEFLFVLPRTGPRQARRVAERLLQRIREHRFMLPDGTTLKVTVSIGAASFAAHCRDVDSLYAAADRALYVAKSGGKDRMLSVDEV